MRHAFKEWAIVIDALLRGDQLIILRKGGVSEGAGGFQVAHRDFLLFPTLFHQQRERVVASAQARFDQISATFPAADQLRISGCAQVVAWRELKELSEAQALAADHIWRNEVIEERFDWGRSKSIYAMIVRAHKFARPVELPMTEAYAGCRSWVELETDVAIEGSTPALSDAEFAARLQRLNSALSFETLPPTPVSQ